MALSVCLLDTFA
ncbi:hypothetical protein DLR65_18980 [Vibrio tarriae]|nr:hypothetical protein [Vibrio cholerae]ELN9189186.1 hypothetical protein [Vibrio cholerae]RBM44881.1 hypothetical protein DLR65_18980 [Vibrio tarriae]